MDLTLSGGVPVFRTSSYLFKSTGHAAKVFALKELGNIYKRLMNPTTDILEQRVSMLEGGAASVAFSSGTAAIFSTIVTIAEAGDNIVSASNLYGGTYTQFDVILPKLGIQTRFVDAREPRNFKQAIDPKTRALFIETIGNPVLDFTNVKPVADVAHEHGLPLIVDATFTTPYLLRTIEHGADIVINSLTKWMGVTAPLSEESLRMRDNLIGRVVATLCFQNRTRTITACAGLLIYRKLLHHWHSRLG